MSLKEQCLTCKNVGRTNYQGNDAVDVWCKLHNTSFKAGSKCDFYDAKTIPLKKRDIVVIVGNRNVDFDYNEETGIIKIKE